MFPPSSVRPSVRWLGRPAARGAKLNLRLIKLQQRAGSKRTRRSTDRPTDGKASSKKTTTILIFLAAAGRVADGRPDGGE